MNQPNVDMYAWAIAHHVNIAIAVAIHTVATDPNRVVDAPTPDEQYDVEAAAWEMADPAETELQWGAEMIPRPA